LHRLRTLPCARSDATEFRCRYGVFSLLINTAELWQVKQITRTFQVADGELSYVVQMATITTSLQPHLKALLRRI
jgi:hypothetical protein